MLIDRCLCGEVDGNVESHNGVKVLRCRCGVARLDYAIDARSYEQQYNDGSYHTSNERHPGCVPYTDRYANDYRVAKLRVERYRSVVNGHWSPGMVALDVGCANGAFVHYMRSVDVLAFGMDRNPKVPRWCIRGDVQSIRFARRRFRFVTYHDVLEHIVDPIAEVQGVRRLMADGSVLVVDVPDVSVPQGSHHWKLEHVWYFTSAALRVMLEGAGFSVLHEDHPIPGKLVMYGVAA